MVPSGGGASDNRAGSGRHVAAVACRAVVRRGKPEMRVTHVSAKEGNEI